MGCCFIVLKTLIKRKLQQKLSEKLKARNYETRILNTHVLDTNDNRPQVDLSRLLQRHSRNKRNGRRREEAKQVSQTDKTKHSLYQKL